LMMIKMARLTIKNLFKFLIVKEGQGNKEVYMKL
jgi:hypothetical protein